MSFNVNERRKKKGILSLDMKIVIYKKLFINMYEFDDSHKYICKEYF